MTGDPWVSPFIAAPADGKVIATFVAPAGIYRRPKRRVMIRLVALRPLMGRRRFRRLRGKIKALRRARR